MCNPAMFALSAGMNAAGAFGSAQTAKNNAGVESQVDTNNAQAMEWEADNAIKRGETQVQNIEMKGAQIQSAQKVAMAANGIAVGVGSAGDVLTTSKYMTGRDVATAENNTANEAWGYRVRAQNYRANAAMSEYNANSIKPWMSAAGSLLTSAAMYKGANPKAA